MQPNQSIPLLSWQGLVFVAFLAAVAVLLYSISPVWTRRRVTRWAESHGLHLVSVDAAPIWKGPRAWRRNRYAADYRIIVETRTGSRREGWLLENWPFLNLGRPSYQVEWDEEEADRFATPR